jgi:hypothetical protein
VRRADDTMDHRVKSGAIAAAVEDSDAHKFQISTHNEENTISLGAGWRGFRAWRL